MHNDQDSEQPAINKKFKKYCVIDEVNIFSLTQNIKKTQNRVFPGGPEVRTPCFHCRECEFDPWLGN